MYKSRAKNNRTMVLVAVVVAGLGLAVQVEAIEIVKSPSGSYEVELDRALERAVVYMVSGDTRLAQYTVTGDLDSVHITDDGRTLVSCDHWLNEGFKAKAKVVRVFRGGVEDEKSAVKLKDVVKKKSLQGPSRIQWGQCMGFEGGNSLKILTVESKGYLYNTRTSSLTLTSGSWPPPVEVEVAEEIRTQPPGDCDKSDPREIFCDEFKEYRAGWKQVRGKWHFEEVSQSLAQTSESVKDGNAIMYFDNLNLADANIVTFLKMDWTKPEVGIEEDQPRIRRIRRIAGAGLVFRLQDENNYYMFRIAGEEGLVLGKMVNGEWYDLANPRAEDFMAERLRYNQWYGLRVRVRGSEIQCFILEWVKEGEIYKVGREQAVASLRDDTFSTGRAGVSSFQVKAEFAYLKALEP